MASRPAPRKSNKKERAFLADVRRASKNKNISMTDVYNYERQKQDEYRQGISSGRALGGMINAQPTVAAEKVTDKSDPISRGILNMQTQGRNMEGLFGDQVNPFGQKVDPAAARAYREATGRNPLYKFTFDKDTQREGNVYANIQEPDVMAEVAKALPTDFATSLDKLVRGVSGDRADTSRLFTLGGRLANEGEFAYESRKGDKAGIADDLLNAANLATYVIGGSGAALKGAGLAVKAGKGYDTAATLNKAARMGRVTNPLDVGVPVAAQAGPSILDNSKATGIAGGTGAAVLAGLLTRGKGAKTMAATAAGAVGGASIASSAVPEEAEAANIKSIVKAGIDSDEAARMINSSWSYRLKKDIEKWKDRAENLGSGTLDFYKAGLGQRPINPVRMGWSKKGIGEGAYSVLPAKPVELVKDFMAKNTKFMDDDIWDGEIVWGHDVAKSKGGGTTRSNVYVIPARTNTKQGDRTLAEFVDDEFKTGNYASIDDVIIDNGLSHIPRDVLGIQ